MEQPIEFSEREKQVVEHLMQGKSNKEIALALGVSLRTVEFHLSRIYRKLGVTSRTEAALQLSRGQLRESTEADLRQATVPAERGSNHNAETSTFMKRIQMNKSSIIGIIVLVTIFFVGSIYSIAKERADAHEQSLDPGLEITPNLETVTTSARSTMTAFTPTIEFLQPTSLPIAAHTVNGYTAAIESSYADLSHVIFQVRISGGEINFGDPHFYDRLGGIDLFDENGNLINSSGGFGPATDPTLYQFEFVPVTLFKGDRLKGQFAFDLRDAPTDYNRVLASFRFDFDLPIYTETRFYPKQSVIASGLEILLDSVTVTPTFTQAYLCFSPPTFAPWTLGHATSLQIDGEEAVLYTDRLLFASDLGGDRRAGSEPYWVPPTKNGRCSKIGFPVGTAHPTTLTLTIPELENVEPDILLTDQLAADYPGLRPKEAYFTYLAEHGKVMKGPWVFNIQLKP